LDYIDEGPAAGPFLKDFLFALVKFDAAVFGKLKKAVFLNELERGVLAEEIRNTVVDTRSLHASEVSVNGGKKT
jgi:hypothetical protein